MESTVKPDIVGGLYNPNYDSCADLVACSGKLHWIRDYSVFTKPDWMPNYLVSPIMPWTSNLPGLHLMYSFGD